MLSHSNERGKKIMTSVGPSLGGGTLALCQGPRAPKGPRAIQRWSPQRMIDWSINLTNFHRIREWIILTLNSIKRSRKWWEKLKSRAQIRLKWRRYRHMVSTVRGNQGKSLKTKRVREKSRNVKVPGCKSWQECRKKFSAVICRLRTTIVIFFCSLRSQIICRPTSAFKFLPPPLFLVWL